jgi:hypothetical protein
MDGQIYDVDEWFKMIQQKETELSEGARWWLSRIAARKESG